MYGMNKLAMTGIVAAVIVSGALGAYAMVQSDTDIIPQKDVKGVVSDIQEDVTEFDPGFGQIDKDEGAYSP